MTNTNLDKGVDVQSSKPSDTQSPVPTADTLREILKNIDMYYVSVPRGKVGYSAGSREAQQALITYIETEIIGEDEPLDGSNDRFIRKGLRTEQRAILRKEHKP